MLDNLKADGFDRVNPSIIKESITDIYPDFTERSVGFRKFSDMMKALEGSRAGDVVTVTVWRPDTVYDAARGNITYAGDYVENIQVTLAVLEEVNNT